MSYIIPYCYRLHLVSRNEGKIKSYESCVDIRAWSHDVEDRSKHLKAWIRSDMPICVIPISALAFSLRTMGCKNRGRITPRCQPNCKSKVVLESICTSCHTIKQCFQNDPKYEKYFEEEELETSHWPCDRCLEALKSIKMIWRIIMEKVFRVNFPKKENIPLCPLSTRNDNVENTAKTWQRDIVYEALFVKNMMPLLDQDMNVKTNSCPYKSEDSVRILPRRALSDRATSTCYKYDNCDMSNTCRVSEDIKTNRPRKVSRSISVKIKKCNNACQTFGDGDHDAYNNNLCQLQKRLNEQKAAVEKLKNENLSLKVKLKKMYCGFTTEPHTCTASDSLAVLPKPFEDQQSDSRFVGNVDSEMIITMKNCRNSEFKQVSLFQILHKTNKPLYDTASNASCSCKKEDPIHVLSKIQNTFGAIVQREMGLAGDKQQGEPSSSDIKAFYHNVNIRPSSSRLSCKSKLSALSECKCDHK